jgi:hypothetical protein
MTNTDSAATTAADRTTVDRWVEALQILAGDADNPTTEDRAVMAATRTKMLAILGRGILNEAIEAARGEYLEDATGTPEDEAYNQGVSDVVAAIGALLETGRG